jgi:hypothetical protein
MSETPQTVIEDKTSRSYDRRAVVAKVCICGKIMQAGLQHPIYKYLTFKMPKGEVFGAEFTGYMAPVDRFGNLRTEVLKEGDIIVRPGLLYRRMLTMPGALMLAHLDAMKTWVPPLPVMKPYVDSGDAGVDMGVIDLRGIKKH